MFKKATFEPQRKSVYSPQTKLAKDIFKALDDTVSKKKRDRPSKNSFAALAGDDSSDDDGLLPDKKRMFMAEPTFRHVPTQETSKPKIVFEQHFKPKEKEKDADKKLVEFVSEKVVEER